MSTIFDAVFSSWTARPWLAAALLLWAVIYLRGWRILRRRDPYRWHAAKAAAWIGGLFAVYLALASPIEAFASLLLTVHMVQHLLLMMAVPVLLLAGDPFLPLMRGLPIDIRRYWIAPLLRWPPLAWISTAIVQPVTAWIIFAATTWLWHLPGPYELALANDSWHVVQHMFFLTAGLIFWYPVMRPFPARPSWSPWLLVPYLLLADVQNTLLSAWLTFSDHVWYPHYVQMPRLGGFSALDDQAAAGVTMWVPGSVVFLAPLAWIGVRLMQGQKSEVRSRESGVGSRGSKAFPIPHSPLSIPHFDLLRLPILGRALRWPWTRRLIQLAVLVIVVAVIVDGLLGPQVGAMNLAGVVPWIHWRGLVILGLLVVGNVFCYACPFMLPRTIARHLLGAANRRQWPVWLRSKWLAIGLMVLFLWSYEAFALWNSPWLTAWIAIAYFAGALIIDSVFRDASFCKYVCPIGQFNFVQSLLSPLEVRVRQPSVCSSCQTHDCIQGRGSSPGCELQLFQPRKVGNLDCTFCLDCVTACPHENVGVIAVAPTASLWPDGPCSGVGRLSHRFDYAVLAVVLVFGAFANAAGMVTPVVDWQTNISAAAGLSSTFIPTTVFYVLCLFALPAISIGAAATASRRLGLRQSSIREVMCRFAWSLVPLGCAMWLAHYSFHFFTSCDTIVPVTQRFAADFHLAALGAPDWVCSCCRPAPDWLLKAELLMLDFGLLTTLYSVWRISGWQIAGSGVLPADALGRTWKIAWPWVVLAAALFAVGVWILLQPMQMRGSMPGG
jgi:cytochrome c oxidase assembly factor CtaG/ferredoxin